MEKVTLLPKWALTSKFPSVYDTESGTTLEMTAKLYAAVQELQIDYNEFVDNINPIIGDFKAGIIETQEEFEEKITKVIHDYIIALDLKLSHQDRVIDEAILYIKDNLNDGIKQVVEDMKESGELTEGILEGFNALSSRIQTIENTLPTKVSDLENDSDFATKGYVDNEIATFDFIKVVNILPETGLPNRIYFVPKNDTQSNDLFDEYAWIDDKWEWITTKQIEVDLTPYYTKDEVYSKSEIDVKSNYSTTEQKIANWIDGKPLYRKVIEGTTPGSVNDSKWIVFANIPNLKDIFTLNGMVKSANDQVERYPVPYTTSYEGGIQSILFYYNVNNGNIYIKVKGNGADWYYSKPCTVIVEYTKTTD